MLSSTAQRPDADRQTCAPRTVAEVVALVNRAHRGGWRISADGPVPERTLLLDLSRHMDRVRIDRGTEASVTALTGITIEALLTRLEESGYGLAACPAAGDTTLGGALATSSALSHLILSLTAVVWDPAQQAYVARTVRRSDPRMAALLVHRGRALILAATLRVGPVQRLRCVSRTDIGAATVFAPPAAAGPHSFAALLERCGRVESTWFPFTPAPWLKTWSVSPERPATSRETQSPYNYPFADRVSAERAALIRQLMDGNTWVTPLFTGLAYAAVVAGLRETASVDLWGLAKNTQLYARPSTLRFTSHEYVVLTKRDRVQHVVSTFHEYVSTTLERYRAEDRFPVNGPCEVRANGLDDPAGRAGDTAVRLSLQTLPGTPDSQRFFAELDAWSPATFTGPHEAVYRDGQPSVGHAAKTTLRRLDPHRVFSNVVR